jgi:hypothetical protein
MGKPKSTVQNQALPVFGGVRPRVNNVGGVGGVARRVAAQNLLEAKRQKEEQDRLAAEAEARRVAQEQAKIAEDFSLTPKEPPPLNPEASQLATVGAKPQSLTMASKVLGRRSRRLGFAGPGQSPIAAPVEASPEEEDAQVGILSDMEEKMNIKKESIASRILRRKYE